MRYKTQLIARGFFQRPVIDYDGKYSPIMDTIMFHFLISLVVFEELEMHLIDVVRFIRF